MVEIEALHSQVVSRSSQQVFELTRCELGRRISAADGGNHTSHDGAGRRGSTVRSVDSITIGVRIGADLFLSKLNLLDVLFCKLPFHQVSWLHNHLFPGFVNPLPGSLVVG